MWGSRSSRFASVSVVAAVTAVLGASPALAVPHGPWLRTERAVQSASPDAARVKESYVSLRFRLPPEAGSHPAGCDWIHYLRFRDAAGPVKEPNADAIFVTVPGR